ncbi:MAG: serine/threonine protein phosphatase [Deltaproteobacteria bacterium]|nr:MAG: serine/threonine protein phosphatase [Deltaproteobacteria bacterium]
MEKIYAIGDIHGRYDKLIALMDKIDADFESDTIVFLGDYIDRGPNSFEVVDYLVKLKKQYPDIVFLKGNHEDMLENYLSGVDRMTYLINGGQQTLDSYLSRSRNPQEPLIPNEHLAFYSSLLLYYETEHYIFVHAGLKKNVSLENQKLEDLLWIRGQFIQTKHDFGKLVVFGHTPLPEPLLQPNKIGIDTGAVYGNKLTCVRLPELVFYTA